MSCIRLHVAVPVALLMSILASATPIMRREGHSHRKGIVVDSGGNVRHKHTVDPVPAGVVEARIGIPSDESNTPSGLMDLSMYNTLVDEDPETHAMDLNHHFLLHQVEANSIVDGVLFLENGAAFRTKDLEMVCDAFQENTECLTQLGIGVVRTSVQNLKQILKLVPQVQFGSLKENMPRFVNFLRHHINKSTVQALFDQYESAGVQLPVNDIMQKFNEEHAERSEFP